MQSTRSRRLFGRALVIASAALLSISLLAGCGAKEAPAPEPEKAPAAQQFEGKTLAVYCGAGMTDPFQEIANAFQEETGCAVEVTFANAAQIQTQIETTETGDFFIAGSVEELKRVEQYVAASTDLVKHIPVLAVPANNPKNITCIADLENVDMLLVGDPESTPIGKIAMKALNQAGLWDGLMARGAISTTTTAPQIATALAKGEGDAGIVWKENVKDDGAAIVETTDLDGAIKTIPAATLTFAQDDEVVAAFLEFMTSDTAMDIWASYGYEQA